jgi:hypothetical protein
VTSPGPAHLDLDALADLLAGEGTAAQTEHVTACAVCSGALVDLDAALVPVAAELAAAAAAPLPAPPPDLEDRLLARLRAEPAPAAPEGRRTGALPVADPDDERAHPPGATVLPARRPAPRPAPRRDGLGVAAGAVALLALVGLGIGLAARTGGGDKSASSSSAASGGSASAARPTAAVPTSATGTDYAPGDGSLARALPALLAAPAVPPAAARAAAPTSQAAGPDPLARLHDPAVLAGCLSTLGAQPLALDYARFSGAPALVVVLPSARPTVVDVYVVGPGCRKGDDQTRYFRRLPRP